MKKIVIPDETPIGVAGNGDSITLAIFLDDADEAIELEMTPKTANTFAANLYRVYLEIKSRKNAA